MVEASHRSGTTLPIISVRHSGTNPKQMVIDILQTCAPYMRISVGAPSSCEPYAGLETKSGHNGGVGEVVDYLRPHLDLQRAASASQDDVIQRHDLLVNVHWQLCR